MPLGNGYGNIGEYAHLYVGVKIAGGNLQGRKPI